MVRIALEAVSLEGDLEVPSGAKGLVLFAHGSGSGRHSPRNRSVAGVLQKAGLGTLLVDLLTLEEEAIDERTLSYRFDMDLLANRLTRVADWLQQNPVTHDLPFVLFGASTGASAALFTAARRPDAVRAVVSRGGRPDLAAPALLDVKAPTLLIVGGHDPEVIQMNKRAMTLLSGEKELRIIPGATHLFEEPGALETVAGLARDWFITHLDRASAADLAA